MSKFDKKKLSDQSGWKYFDEIMKSGNRSGHRYFDGRDTPNHRFGIKYFHQVMKQVSGEPPPLVDIGLYTFEYRLSADSPTIKGDAKERKVLGIEKHDPKA